MGYRGPTPHRALQEDGFFRRPMQANSAVRLAFARANSIAYVSALSESPLEVFDPCRRKYAGYLFLWLFSSPQ